MTWSYKSKPRSVKELTDHLRKILREEKNMVIPNKPPVDVPKRREIPMLGDDGTDEVMKLDEKHFQYESKFRQDAKVLRDELESKGEGNMFLSMQPFIQPCVHDLVGKQIDVLSTIDGVVGQESQLRWCQGLLTEVLDNSAPRVPNGKERDTKVMVQWDGMVDLTGWEEGGKMSQVLKPHLWNKDRLGAWRLDIDVLPCAAYESDEESDKNVDEISVGGVASVQYC